MSARRPSALPSGTVTFLFSDIEGSTRLLRELGAAGYGTVLEQHNRLLREAFGEAGGVEIDRQGDSFFFAFRSAGAAVAAAVAAQRALAAAEWPGRERVAVRIGVHTGEASVTPNGYVGLAVHHAARIGDIGHGGQVLLSATTAALVEHDLPADVRLRALGQARLQGVERPQHLHQLVVDGLPSEFPALGARAATAAAAAVAGPPLLERDAEVAAIRALVETARGGSGRLLAFEGGAGIGKTRLVAETRAIAEAAGFAVLNARGGELEHDFAWGVVRQLFEPLLVTASASERSELLGGAAALAASLFDETQLDGLEAGDASFSLLHGLYWLAANQAQRRPTLIAIDDLHWADGPTLRWLAYLAHRLEGLPLLVTAGLRPPEQSREGELLSELLSDPATVVVRPGALSLPAVRALVHELYGVDPDEPFVSAIHAATGGNPLFVHALVDTLKAQEVAPVSASVNRVRETGPEPVARVVALRLARLPAEANALARAVAVLGDGTDLETAARLADLDRDLAGHAATTLARADLLRIELPLEFVHPVVRAAVYDRITPNERPLEHRRAARVLADANALPEQVAAHLLLAPAAADPEALATLRTAAERAIRRGAPEAAIDFLQRALAEAPDERSQAAVLVDLGMAERRLDVAAAAKHLAEAIGYEDDPAERGGIAVQLGRSLMRDNRHREAIPVFQKAIAELPEHEVRLRQFLTTELISASWWEPDLNPIAVEALSTLNPDEMEPGLERDILCSELAYYEARRGVDRNRSLELARRSITPTLLESEGAVALLYTGYTLTLTGCYDEAETYFGDAVQAARERGDLVTLVGLLVFRGHMQVSRGNLREAEEDFALARELGLYTRYPVGGPYLAGYSMALELERGNIPAAETQLAAANLPEGPPPNVHVMFLQLTRGRLRLELRDAEAALRDFRMVGEYRSGLGIDNPATGAWRSGMALALHALGKRKEALPYAIEEVELARRWGAPRGLGFALRTLAVLEGGDAGMKLLEESVDALEDSGARLELARSLVELGSALRRANRRADSRDLLRRGLELAHRCGAPPLEERAHAELAATGARPRRVVLSGVDALTPSERRVAEHAAEGLSNKEIAQTLFVTTKTVEVHLSNVYRKLEISSRNELADALRVDDPEPAAV